MKTIKCINLLIIISLMCTNFRTEFTQSHAHILCPESLIQTKKQSGTFDEQLQTVFDEAKTFWQTIVQEDPGQAKNLSKALDLFTTYSTFMAFGKSALRSKLESNNQQLLKQILKNIGGHAESIKFIQETNFSMIYEAKIKSDKSVILKIAKGSHNEKAITTEKEILELLNPDRGLEDIPILIAAGEIQDTYHYPYIVIEKFPEGQNLGALLKTVELDGIMTFQIIRSFLNTLKYVHKKGILHRDLKPENIWIKHNTGIILYDFGISKQLNQNNDASLTATYGYVPPGFYDLPKFIPYIDIFAFAGIFLECLGYHIGPSGAQPLDTAQLVQAVNQGYAIRLSQIKSLADGKLKNFLFKCTRQDDHYQTIEQMERDFLLLTPEDIKPDIAAIEDNIVLKQKQPQSIEEVSAPIQALLESDPARLLVFNQMLGQWQNYSEDEFNLTWFLDDILTLIKEKGAKSVDFVSNLNQYMQLVITSCDENPDDIYMALCILINMFRRGFEWENFIKDILKKEFTERSFEYDKQMILIIADQLVHKKGINPVIPLKILIKNMGQYEDNILPDLSYYLDCDDLDPAEILPEHPNYAQRLSQTKLVLAQM